MYAAWIQFPRTLRQTSIEFFDENAARDLHTLIVHDLAGSRRTALSLVLLVLTQLTCQLLVLRLLLAELLGHLGSVRLRTLALGRWRSLTCAMISP